jgi:quinol monooxygenase YgiN
MPVTVVTRMQARAGQADAVITAVAGHFDRVLRPRQACAMAYLFQQTVDETVFLHVAGWRVAWDAPDIPDDLLTAAMPSLDDLLAGPPTVQRTRLIESHERIGVRMGAIGCDIVVGPSGRADALREALMTAARGTLREWSEGQGLVLYRIYENVDRPSELALVHCWQRAEHLAAFDATRNDLLGPLRREFGAAVEHFTGEPRAMVSRLFPL